MGVRSEMLGWWNKRRRRCIYCDSWRVLMGMDGVYVCPHCDFEGACCQQFYLAKLTYVPVEWNQVYWQSGHQFRGPKPDILIFDDPPDQPEDLS